MNLIIDQGNTACKLAIFKGQLLLKKVVFENHQKKELVDWLISNAQNSQVLVSSVLKEKVDLSMLDCGTVIELNHNTPLPIEIKYQSPETLGMDRLANAVSIWKKNPNKCSLAIDLGTCIKYDIVNSSGQYLGGNISPGLRMRYKVLNTETELLPLLDPEELNNFYGIDTKTSILNGVQQGIIHEINGFIDRYIKEFGELTIFMTGGDLKYFDKEIKNTIFADSELTLVGLNEILIYNVENN